MPAKNKKQRLYAVQLLLIVGIPVLILFVGIILLKIREPEFLPKVQKQQTPTQTTTFTPSSIASAPLQYDEKTVTIFGDAKIYNKDCGQNPILVLTDPSQNMLNGAKEIKMFAKEKNPLCEKKAGTCDVVCNDFSQGNEYEVTGKIILERPLGMTLSRGYLDYYLEVERSQKVLKQDENVKNNPVENIIQKFQSLFSPKPL